MIAVKDKDLNGRPKKRLGIPIQAYSRRWLSIHKSILENPKRGIGEVETASFKDVDFLSKFVNRQGSINNAITNKLLRRQQRKITSLIKIARELGLMHYINSDISV